MAEWYRMHLAKKYGDHDRFESVKKSEYSQRKSMWNHHTQLLYVYLSVIITVYTVCDLKRGTNNVYSE
jgi:hypothetical protein